MRYAPGRFDLSDVQRTPKVEPVRAFTCASAPPTDVELSDRRRELEEAYHHWKGGPR